MLHDTADLLRRKDFRIIAAVKYNADLLPGLCVQFFLSQDGSMAGFLLDQAYGRMDRGAFSGAVSPISPTIEPLGTVNET